MHLYSIYLDPRATIQEPLYGHSHFQKLKNMAPPKTPKRASKNLRKPSRTTLGGPRVETSLANPET